MEAVKPYNPGILEVYTGPMRCGKTLKIALRVNKLKHLEDIQFIAFKPSTDTRSEEIESRDGFKIPSVTIPSNEPERVLDYIKEEHKVIVFSETQFFDKYLAQITERLLKERKNVIVEGLNLDFRGEPFGIMPFFLSRADHIEVLTAICDYHTIEGEKRVRCQNPATRTQRLINERPADYNSPIVLIGDKSIIGQPRQSYECRCLEHHFVPNIPDLKI